MSFGFRTRADGRHEACLTRPGEAPRPAGYCSPWRGSPSSLAKLPAPLLGFAQAEAFRLAPRKALYHDTGHGTRLEAEVCWWNWILDNATRPFAGPVEAPCVECRKPTDRRIEVRFLPRVPLPLCHEHQGTPFLRRHFPLREA